MSGSLDLSLPAFPGSSGGPACEHELCAVGDALEEDCNPCVASVCAQDPSCCEGGGGTWDLACVDLVYELCLSEPRPLSLCDFGLFSASTNQVTLNNLLAPSDITVGGLGNITVSGGSGHNVNRVVTLGPVYMSSQFLPPDGIVASGDITLQPSVSSATVGPLESGANVNLYGLPVVQGDVYARGNIVWETNIYGDAVAGGSVILSGGCGGSVFGGTCTNGSGHAAPDLELPTLPPQAFSCGGTNTNVGGGNLTLTPGNYGDVYVGGQLTLNGAGTYNFTRLYVHDLRLVGGADRIDVQVCNEFNVLTGGRVLDASGVLLTDPALLFVSVQGNLHFDSNVAWVGVILAGSSGTKTGGSINGAIWAAPVNDINSQTSIVGISREDCLALGIAGTAPPVCPIVNAVEPIPAALNEPCASGLDCQINHRCNEPVTDDACAHSKCSEGAALDDACDPCVAAICNEEPACCSAAWSLGCVERVASVCDAVCATDGGLCNAPICSEDPDGTSLCDFTVSAAGSVFVSATSSLAPRPEIVGAIGTAGALSLFWADVMGDLWVGGSFGDVASTHGALTSTGPAIFSSQSSACPAVDGAPTSGVISPGDYGAVVVPAGQTLTLLPGDYSFTSLVLADASASLVATLEVSDAQETRVQVCATPTSVVFGSGAQVTGLTQQTALSFGLYAAGDIIHAANASTFGFFQSGSDISVLGGVHYGYLSSQDTVSVVGDSSVLGSGLREACLLGGYDVTQDPDELSAPSEAGVCEHNETGYEDATCSGFDLALEIPCADQVPVCNHGTSNFSGTVTIAYFDEADPVMSDLSPRAPDGTCDVSVNVVPGQCVFASCPTLPSAPHTLLLDPDGDLNECGSEERNWDNWTVHDGRACAADTAHEFDYVATCSQPGTVPMWGLLTYEATIPGDATIEFWARTGFGDTDADAAQDAQAKAFTEVLVADNTLEECALDSLLPCPVDLTEVLGLGSYQGHHLDLRIVLRPDGDQNPHLSHWDITYSCVVDE